MPLFVRSLFTLADRAQAMRRSAKAQRRIELLKNEATVLGADANLRALEALERSLKRKRKSLEKIRKIVAAKVRSGRAPASSLTKVDDRLMQIEVSLDSVEINLESTRTLIATLSGVELRHAAPLRRRGRLRPGSLAPLAPLKEKLRADTLAARAEQEKLYPSLSLQAEINRGSTRSYLSGRRVERDYGSVGVTLAVPLLDLPQIRSAQKARIQSMKSRLALAKSGDELRRKARSLRRQLALLERTISHTRTQIAGRRKLLEIARESYESGRMVLEEYLRYLDDLYDSEAALAKAQARYWQSFAQLGFLYGADFRRLVR